MLGTVTAFDDPAGIGVITALDGSTYPFHCTQLADGTRTTTVGARVSFRTWARLGALEAAAVEAVPEI